MHGHVSGHDLEAEGCALQLVACRAHALLRWWCQCGHWVVTPGFALSMLHHLRCSVDHSRQASQSHATVLECTATEHIGEFLFLRNTIAAHQLFRRSCCIAHGVLRQNCPKHATHLAGGDRHHQSCGSLVSSHPSAPLPSSHSQPPPPPPETFTLLVVVSTSQPGVFVMNACRALIRPSGEDAMGRGCILDSPPGRGMPAAVRMPAVVRMPACHSRRFKGERPIGTATG